MNWYELKTYADSNKNLLTFHAFFHSKGFIRVVFDADDLMEDTYRDVIAGKYSYEEFQMDNGIPSGIHTVYIDNYNKLDNMREFLTRFSIINDFTETNFSDVFTIILEGLQLSTTDGMDSLVRKKIQNAYYDLEKVILKANAEISTPFLYEEAGSMKFTLKVPGLADNTVNLFEKICADIDNSNFDADFYSDDPNGERYFNIFEKLKAMSNIKEIDSFKIILNGNLKVVSNREFLRSISLESFLPDDIEVIGTVRGLINEHTFTINSERNGLGVIHCKIFDSQLYNAYAKRYYSTSRELKIRGKLIKETIYVSSISI